MPSIVVIAHDIRSTHNVGSLFRTCDGLGIDKLYLSGYTPYPKQTKDKRLPHLADKTDHQIHKTALGAEKILAWEYQEDISKIVENLKSQNYQVVALEQSENSISLTGFVSPDKIALILGNEVTGLDFKALSLTSICLEIPMLGKKESFNVVQAAAMALYHLSFK